jgi:hypothetical protein
MTLVRPDMTTGGYTITGRRAQAHEVDAIASVLGATADYPRERRDGFVDDAITPSDA